MERGGGPMARFSYSARTLILIAGLALGGAACDGGSSEAPAKPTASKPAVAPAKPQLNATEQANQIFSTRCMTCHGPEGRGDGPASAGLTPSPRNFSLKEWQASVTDEHIEKIIQYGGVAVGRAATMPPNPDLMSKPEVVTALRVHIRSLAE